MHAMINENIMHGFLWLKYCLTAVETVGCRLILKNFCLVLAPWIDLPLFTILSRHRKQIRNDLEIKIQNRFAKTFLCSTPLINFSTLTNGF